MPGLPTAHTAALQDPAAPLMPAAHTNTNLSGQQRMARVLGPLQWGKKRALSSMLLVPAECSLRVSGE